MSRHFIIYTNKMYCIHYCTACSMLNYCFFGMPNQKPVPCTPCCVYRNCFVSCRLYLCVYSFKFGPLPLTLLIINNLCVYAQHMHALIAHTHFTQYEQSKRTHFRKFVIYFVSHPKRTHTYTHRINDFTFKVYIKCMSVRASVWLSAQEFPHLKDSVGPQKHKL